MNMDKLIQVGSKSRKSSSPVAELVIRIAANFITMDAAADDEVLHNVPAFSGNEQLEGNQRRHENYYWHGYKNFP
jgi:hypothetical protein